MKRLRFTTLFLAILSAAWSASGPSRAGAATLAIAPSDTTVTLSDEFWLRVTLGPLADLKGCDLVWSYSSPIVSFLAAQAGGVISGGGGAWFDYVLPDAAAPADSVWYDAAVLDGAGAGPGVVAFLKFKAVATGDGVLNCESADLRDSNNAGFTPDCSGAVIHVIGPVPARPLTWGRLKTLYR